MQSLAIYARKSVFREESISIESQIEICKYEARGEDYLVYKDNGFSGKNTDRPDFQRMLNDIKNGKIKKVIVYKLDRISRSVLDFSELMDLFQKNQVDFISATEHFDTSSPMGRAMLNICIVFAQLERETIQQRIIDAYISRRKKGLYMGGRIPYGYSKVPVTINGVKSSMYEEKPGESDDVKLIFDLYSRPGASLGDVLREITSRGLNPNKKGYSWSTARLSELMRNPVYTVSDKRIYQFYNVNEASILSQIEEFDGYSSLYRFKDHSGNVRNRPDDISKETIVIAPHKGFIDPDTWLICRRKLLSNCSVRHSKAVNSFLSGKIKCGYCDYAMIIKYSQQKRYRYLVDTGRYIYKSCKHIFPTIHAKDIEDLIVERIKLKIDSLSIKPNQKQKDIYQDRMISIKSEIDRKDDEIDKLVKATVDATSITMDYINRSIKKLDEEKGSLLKELDRLENEKESNLPSVQNELLNAASHWDELSFDDKVAVVDILINKIIFTDGQIEVVWNV